MRVKAHAAARTGLPARTGLRKRDSLSSKLADTFIGSRHHTVELRHDVQTVQFVEQACAERGRPTLSRRAYAAAAPPPARHRRPTSHQPAALLNWQQQVLQSALGRCPPGGAVWSNEIALLGGPPQASRF
jgi:hypothetical protein